MTAFSSIPCIDLLPPRPSSPRGSGLTWQGDVLTIDVRKSTRYRLEEFPADGGRGFRFVKLDAGSDVTERVYNVFVCARSGGQNDSCDCRGFVSTSRRGPGHCKHLDSILTLMGNGWLEAEVSREYEEWLDKLEEREQECPF
jgi:hypothetical protein